MSRFVGVQCFLKRTEYLKGVLGSHNYEELFDRREFSGSDFMYERKIQLNVNLAVLDYRVVDVNDASFGTRCPFDFVGGR